MSQPNGLNRRAFLRNAGFTAIAGAAAAGNPAPLFAATPESAFEQSNGKFDFDTVYSRFGTDSTKFDQQINRYGKDSVQVGMGIADIDFKAAPPITKALTDRLKHENWGYLDMDTWTPRTQEAIAAWSKRRYNFAIDPKTIVVSNGVHPALIAALKTFSPRGSKVLLQTPTYNGFYSDLTASDTKAEESPLKFVNGKFQMDFEDFERRISIDTHSFILCNPQNPTGNCWSPEDLLRIGEICLKHRVVLLSDEIHCDWVSKGQKYTPFASLANKAVVDNSITFKAASKSFGLAAHKVAWYHSTNPELMARMRYHHRVDLNTLGILAQHAAITEGDEWLNQANAYVSDTHDFVNSYIHDKIPMIKVHRAEGTYLTWLDVTAVAERINSKKLADDYNRTKPANMPALTPEQMVERFFVKTAKVHLNQGASYGKGGENHMRMNIGTSRKLVEQALNNIASACRNSMTTNLNLF
ncbi:MAG TPA: aminotransferase class I/II-fold pyridoxal phosphate-dependent enzyme [Vicinamibacterales bacterium]|nr:aminotransferase class I/II-fold pyridoxal phosphate-dependent enzyme [Vicinamibacterales bacterium]